MGQFFTKDGLWLKPQVINFIKESNSSVAYDPFAGAGDLLRIAKEKCGFSKLVGLDIDDKLSWKRNDSLLNIPHIEDAIIITNPPYISNYSAARKGLALELKKYFATSEYNDVYLIALDRMVEAQKNIVAIIPETFINSNYRRKNLLSSITILEENPFDDTENPVVVACFDGNFKDLSEVKVYKNEIFINNLGSIENLRVKPTGIPNMMFNVPSGWLAVRCVDTTNPENMIKFDFKDNIEYDWENRIKVSSRLLTLVDIDIQDSDKKIFIQNCNNILSEIRKETSDIILSPFKGNMKNGQRRRRLDFMTCRAVIEKAYNDLYGVSKASSVSVSYGNNKLNERRLNVKQQALF